VGLDRLEVGSSTVRSALVPVPELENIKLIVGKKLLIE